MLQPQQLQDVAIRYPQKIAELREFLVKADFSPGMEETLGAVAARLRLDRGFRRDLISHIWVVVHSAGQIGYADLLGILALAAAGTRYAATADEDDAHELLRFLMAARRSFDIAPAANSAPMAVEQAMPPAIAHAQTVQRGGWDAPVLRSRYEPEALRPSADREEFSDDRKAVLWAVGACALAVLLFGVFLYRRMELGHAAPVATTQMAAHTAAAPSAASESQAQPIPRASAAAMTTHPHVASVHRSQFNRSLQASARAANHRSAARAASAYSASSAAAYASAPADGGIAEAPMASRSKRPPSPALTARSGPNALVRPVEKVDLGTEDSGDAPTVAAHARVVRPTSLGVMAANVLYSPAPTYPSDAAAANVQGQVKVEAEVGSDGNVVSARVVSGPPLLRDAAVGAVERWRYRPYVSSEGKPIEVSALVVMDFELK